MELNRLIEVPCLKQYFDRYVAITWKQCKFCGDGEGMNTLVDNLTYMNEQYEYLWNFALHDLEFCHIINWQSSDHSRYISSLHFGGLLRNRIRPYKILTM